MPNDHATAEQERAADGTTTLHEALVMLRGAQQTLSGLGSSGPFSAETMTRVAEDLALAEEELAVQLAEVETAADAHRRGRALTRRLLTELPVAVLTTSREGAIHEANAAAEELLRAPVTALERHKPVFAFVAADDRRPARELLRRVNQGEDGAGAVLLLAPREGDPQICQVVVTRWPPTSSSTGNDLVQWVLQPITVERSPADDRYRETLVELSRLGVTDADLAGLLHRVAELAVRATPGALAASVVLDAPGRPTTIVSTSPVAQAADGVQYMSGTGPVFDVFARGEAILTGAALADPRWPELARIAGNDSGPGCWLGLPLRQDDRPAGVVMLYGTGDPAFTAGTAEGVLPFVRAAETLIRDSQALQEIRTVQEQLREALSSRAVIDQAKGMIMLTHRCPADEAFALLTKMSNDSNRKIRELAAEFVHEAVHGSTMQ